MKEKETDKCLKKDKTKKERQKERERVVYLILWDCTLAGLVLRERIRERERAEYHDELVDSGSQLGVLNPTKSSIPLCLPQQLNTHHLVKTFQVAMSHASTHLIHVR